MRIYAINVQTQSNIYPTYFLQDFGFFKRHTIQNFIDFYTVELRKAQQDWADTGAVQVSTQELDGKQISTFHYTSSNKSIIVYADDEYPQRAVLAMIKQILPLDENEIQTSIDKYIVEYQDPGKTDILFKIKGDLNKAILTVQKSIDSVLERGTKLDDLVRESETLTASSKIFYQEAKKTNNCCLIM